MDWYKMQSEHAMWADRKFPKQPVSIPAMGIVEEAGEVLNAVLHMQRESLWGKDAKRPDTEADLQDAVGDCAIYCVSLCNAAGWTIYHPVYRRAHDLLLQTLAVQLVNIAASGVANPTYAILDCVLTTLWNISVVGGFDFERCVEETWQRVRDR